MRDRAFSYGAAVRLKKGWEFDAVFRTGRQQGGELVRIYYLRKPGERTRVAVTVGRKTAKAVGRSRGRRMLRESIRRILPWIADGVWVVLSLRGKGLTRNAAHVYADVAKGLGRAGLLQPGWPGPDWGVDERCASCNCPPVQPSSR